MNLTLDAIFVRLLQLIHSVLNNPATNLFTERIWRSVSPIEFEYSRLLQLNESFGTIIIIYNFCRNSSDNYDFVNTARSELSSMHKHVCVLVLWTLIGMNKSRLDNLLLLGIFHFLSGYNVWIRLVRLMASTWSYLLRKFHEFWITLGIQ